MAKEAYTKKLNIQVDTSELDKLKKQLDNLYIDTLKTDAANILSAGPLDAESAAKIKQLSDAIEATVEDIKSIEVNKFARDFNKKLKEFGEDVLESLGDFFKEIITGSLRRFEQMASYDISNSIMFNQDAFNQAMRYGISDPAQNYALTQAMERHGIRDETGLMMMSDNLRKAFNESMDYYYNRYQQLADKDAFMQFQKFQLEWEMFRTDLEFSMIDFFMQNKDLIKNAMIKGIEFMQKTLIILDKLLDIGMKSEFEKDAARSEIIGGYSLTNTSTSVNINNTLYPSSQTLTDKSMLEKAGSMSYAQLINALEGS